MIYKHDHSKKSNSLRKGKAMGRDEHHVVPNADGGWDVKRNGADRSSGHFDTKQEAVDSGRRISQNQGTEFVIHNKDGKISQSDSHGNDPYPPKG
ncbi:DUF2188 domain-containing protein [Trichlorobacter lovleyi]|uniref:DUF2188 domain-containing protein n=2 Tax=Trichlorobacter lovleyi TaxID=313985 RepID=UPI002FDDCFEC